MIYENAYQASVKDVESWAAAAKLEMRGDFFI